MTWRQSLAWNGTCRYVIGCKFSQEIRVYNALDDVAGYDCLDSERASNASECTRMNQASALPPE